MVIPRILELTVPRSDNGRQFVEVERLLLIERTLSGSDYVRLGDLMLAKEYAHKRLTPSRSIILLTLPEALRADGCCATRSL